MTILNLTGSYLIDESITEPKDVERVNELLTFHDLPTRLLMRERAEGLVQLAIDHNADEVAIDPPAFFAPALDMQFQLAGIRTRYPFDGGWVKS